MRVEASYPNPAAHTAPPATNVMPAIGSIVSARVRVQLLRMERLNRWTAQNRVALKLTESVTTASTATFLRHIVTVNDFRDTTARRQNFYSSVRVAHRASLVMWSCRRAPRTFPHFHLRRTVPAATCWVTSTCELRNVLPGVSGKLRRYSGSSQAVLPM